MQTEIASSVAASDPCESRLTTDIGELWQSHSQVQESLRKTRKELKEIRRKLSQRLYELKSVLSRSGRGSAWSSFLASAQISRSTGDRFAKNHQTNVVAANGNYTSEHILEPTEATVRRYCSGFWPKLSQTLTTREAVELFVDALRDTAESSFGSSKGAIR